MELVMLAATKRRNIITDKLYVKYIVYQQPKP